MRNVLRSTWFRCVLLLSLVFFAAQCGDESEVVIVKQECVENFPGGAYTFTVAAVQSPCLTLLPEELREMLPSPGDDFGPLQLPPSNQLPPTLTITLPEPFFEVSVNVEKKEGGVIEIRSTEAKQVQIAGFLVEAEAAGSICPQLDGSLLATFTFTFTSFGISCDLLIGADGYPAAG